MLLRGRHTVAEKGLPMSLGQMWKLKKRYRMFLLCNWRIRNRCGVGHVRELTMGGGRCSRPFLRCKMIYLGMFETNGSISGSLHYWNEKQVPTMNASLHYCRFLGLKDACMLRTYIKPRFYCSSCRFLTCTT